MPHKTYQWYIRYQNFKTKQTELVEASAFSFDVAQRIGRSELPGKAKDWEVLEAFVFDSTARGFVRKTFEQAVAH